MSNRRCEEIEFEEDNEEAPIISVTFTGTSRIEYGIILNDPNALGHRLGHWTGNNTDSGKVELPLLPERPNLPSPKLSFAVLDWLFITWPNPGTTEPYEIQIRVEQAGKEIYSRKYSGTPEKPVQENGCVIFVPKI